MINKLSIITPTKNNGIALKRTVESILNQTHLDKFPVRHVIVDSNSVDDTSEIIGRFQRSQRRGYELVFKSEADESMTEALNKGLAIVGTEFYLVLNAGDVLLNNAVDVFLSFLLNDDTRYAGYVFGSLYYYQNKHRVREIRPIFMNSELAISILDTHVPSSSAVLRTSCVKEVGGYDESYRFSQDTNLYIRLLQKGSRFYLSRTPVSIFLRNSEQVSSRFAEEQNREVQEFVTYSKLYSFFGKSRIRSVLRLILGIYGFEKNVSPSVSESFILDEKRRNAK